MFTSVQPPASLASKNILPEDTNGRALMKLVYVVLEPQYQSALSAAVHSINRNNPSLAIQVNGYLIEDLRNAENYELFKADLADANVFIGSLIFIDDIAQKIVAAVEPVRDKLDVCLVFPSMPEVMRLNKMGSLSMANLGQSKSAIAQFMRKRKEKSGSSFQDSMLKVVQTLPKILKYMPIDKAQDARNFMLSFQYWLGGSPENLENFLLMLADNVEARTRSERPRTEEEIRAVVQKAIDFCQKEGQLADTRLTLKDLTAITEVFVTALTGFYHPRIAYPAAEASVPTGSTSPTEIKK